MTNASTSHLITSYEQPKKENDNPSGWLILFGLLTAPLAGAWYAFVVYKFYGWFVLPLGAPVLNWWHVWGLTMFFNMVVAVLWPYDNRKLSEVTMSMVVRSFVFAITLLVGWIVSGQI